MRWMFMFLFVISLMSGGPSAFATEITPGPDLPDDGQGNPIFETTYAHVLSYAVVSDTQVRVVLSDMSYAADNGCSPDYYTIAPSPSADPVIQTYWLQEQIRIVADAMSYGKVVEAGFFGNALCTYPHEEVPAAFFTRTNLDEVPIEDEPIVEPPVEDPPITSCTSWDGWWWGTDPYGNPNPDGASKQKPTQYCDNNDGTAPYTCSNGCPAS